MGRQSKISAGHAKEADILIRNVPAGHRRVVAVGGSYQGIAFRHADVSCDLTFGRRSGAWPAIEDRRRHG
jgi:hypothetical protein